MATTDRRTGAYADYAIGTPLLTAGSETATEVNNLTRIECGIVDSIDTPRSSGETSLAGLCASETFSMPTRIVNGPITGECFYEEDGTNVYWTAFDDTGDRTVVQDLVLCPKGFSGAAGVAAANDVVHVIPVRIGHRQLILGGEDDAERFAFQLVVAGTPRWDVTLT